MQSAVVVVRAFGSHPVGTLILDEAELAKIANGEHVDHVVKIVPPAPLSKKAER